MNFVKKRIDKQLDKNVKIFSAPYDLASAYAADMSAMISKSARKKIPFTIALSGGTTPEILFSVLSDRFAGTLPWQYVHFFWGDERCVPPSSPESNYGMTNRKLLSKIDIPARNIHRIIGENEPSQEALRYSDEIVLCTRERYDLPRFDLVLLGIGEDGHTASIFPGQTGIIHSDKICEVASHPVTGQKRITITGRVINNANEISFLVTGKKKAEVVGKILGNDPLALNFPASHIAPVNGSLNWLLDMEAGSLL